MQHGFAVVPSWGAAESEIAEGIPLIVSPKHRVFHDAAHSIVNFYAMRPTQRDERPLCAWSGRRIKALVNIFHFFQPWGQFHMGDLLSRRGNREGARARHDN